jgi:sulfur carrier protein ThiS
MSARDTAVLIDGSSGEAMDVCLVQIFKAKTAVSPDATYSLFASTIEQLLIENVPNYERRPVPLYSIAVNGILIPPAQWENHVLKNGDIVDIRVEPKFGAEVIFAVIALASAVYAYTQIPDLPDTQKSTPEGRTIYKASAQANAAKVFGIVPEIFGRMPRYPDKITPGYRQYEDNDEVYSVHLCIGIGEYDLEQVRIGFTDANAYAGDIFYGIIGPGEEALNNPATRHIYTAPEVGRTSSGAMEIKYDQTALDDTDWTYDFEGFTITSKFGGVPATFPFGVGDEFTIPGDRYTYRVESLGGTNNSVATVSRGTYPNWGFGGFS